MPNLGIELQAEFYATAGARLCQPTHCQISYTDATLERQEGIPNTRTRQPVIFRLPRYSMLTARRRARAPLFSRSLRRHRIKSLFHYLNALGAVRMRGD